MRRPIPCAAEIEVGHTYGLRSGAGERLSPTQVSALLADVRGNPGTTAKIQIDAVTYLQEDGKPNRNFVRFRDGAMRSVAKSFIGAPFLRDHNQRDLLSRGGTVIDSQLTETDAGVRGFHQTIELVKPWAVEAALDGTMDRFSIGWRADGPVTCSICGEAYADSWFGPMASCDHELGKEYETRGGVMKIAQAEFSGAIGVECSGVSVPAVADTGIEGIRIALAAGDRTTLAQLQEAIAAFGRTGGAVFPVPLEESEMKAIALALGLAATVDEATILAEVQKRETLLEAERRGRIEAEARLAAALEVASAQRRTDLAARALREGKIRPNSDLAAKIDQLALANIEAAEALVNELPRVTLAGAPLLSTQPALVPPQDAASQLSETDKEVCRQFRLTPEQFIASKAGRV
jgi:hypothetical protein